MTVLQEEAYMLNKDLNVSLAQPAHAVQVCLGIWIELVTIVWMTIEAGIAISVGFATHSV
jgi:hypothetical protein